MSRYLILCMTSNEYAKNNEKLIKFMTQEFNNDSKI